MMETIPDLWHAHLIIVVLTGPWISVTPTVTLGLMLMQDGTVLCGMFKTCGFLFSLFYHKKTTTNPSYL